MVTVTAVEEIAEMAGVARAVLPVKEHDCAVALIGAPAAKVIVRVVAPTRLVTCPLLLVDPVTIDPADAVGMVLNS